MYLFINFILVHSRAKFPFEEGFVCTNKRLKKSIPEENQAPLIKGVFVAKNGLVYPCKKKTEPTKKPIMKKVKPVDDDIPTRLNPLGEFGK